MSHLTVRRLLAIGLTAFVAHTAPSLAASALAGQSAPPSLADLARKEAERRKTSKEAKKVITTKDMPESARRPTSTPAPADAGAPATAAASGGDQKPAAGGDAASTDDKGEAGWRNRITQAREMLRRNEAFLEAMRTRVNSLTSDALSRSDPLQKAKLRQDRDNAVDEMARLKADIEQGKKQITDIEEEARQAGVPPGWLR